jgi:hypothetical protein
MVTSHSFTVLTSAWWVFHWQSTNQSLLALEEIGIILMSGGRCCRANRQENRKMENRKNQ